MRRHLDSCAVSAHKADDKVMMRDHSAFCVAINCLCLFFPTHAIQNPAFIEHIQNE
jgi:hypothetical protein